MTQGIEARVETAPAAARTSPHVRLAEWWLWLGVGGVTAAAAAFLLHQLMAWPPHEDETLALFGASGSGKTSTLRAIAGLSQPTSGRISVAG